MDLCGGTNLVEDVEDDGGDRGIDEENQGETRIGGKNIGLDVVDVGRPNVLEGQRTVHPRSERHWRE